MGNRQLFPEKSAIELLVEFRESGSQKPFEEIVRRYAAMVFGVCMRVTGDKHDAEDATQAVFLSLALQSKTSREIKYIGPWLQKVAHRLALDVKKSKTRRKRREEKLVDQARHNGNGHNGNGRAFLGGNGHTPNPADSPATEELKRIMLEELNLLPVKYRMPLVMHYFGGLSREEMAAELKCNPSTLGVRVHRGKSMLGTRLAKRGFALTAVSFGVVLEHAVQAATMQPLVSAGASASGLVAGSGGASAVVAAAKVIAITRIVAKSLLYAKARYTVILVLMIGTTAWGTAGTLAKYIDLKNLRLPIPLDIRQWIRPLLKSLTPSLRADATTGERPEDATGAAAIQPLAINVDWKTLGLESADPPPAVPVVIAQAVAQQPASQKVESKPQLDNAHEKPKLNAFAQAMLNPPIAPRTSSASIGEYNDAVGSDSTAASDDSSSTAETTTTISASSGQLLIGAGGGGGFGKPDIYTLPANVTLRSQSQVIGGAGFGVFRQNGGNNIIDGTLTIGRDKTGVGRYELNAGTLTALREVIGDEGDGAFIQANGVNIAREGITIGKGGNGLYCQNGGETVVVASANPPADISTDPNGLHIGEDKTGKGHYELKDGTLSADPQLIGVAGDGTFTQTGGKNVTGAIGLGLQAGSSGDYKLVDGKLVFVPRTSGKPEAAIRIGGKGRGTFNLGNANKTGSIFEVSGETGGGSVVVRGQPSADGTLIGWGPIKLGGALVNNGQITADGFQQERTLDLSSFGWVTSSIENPRWGGANGWFARREGKLTLPSIPVKAGTNTYTWGEDNGDPMIDLVNSVRFTIDNARKDGNVSISLLSTIRDDIPTLPIGHRFIGVWSFDGSDLGGFDGVELNVRYDDGMAKTLGLDEEILKLWCYNPADSQWERINDSSFYRNSLDHLLTGYTSADMTYFAVSAPEPGGAMLLLAAGGMLLRRKRRQ